MQTPIQPDCSPVDPALPRAGARPHNPYDVLGQADDLHARIAGLQAALDHRERLATLGTIAGLIAHEFNNLLTPVLSYAQMALAEPDDKALTAKALTRAVEGTERAAAIAAAILGFVRDERGGVAGSPDVPRGTSSPAKEMGKTCDVEAAVQAALGCLAREPRKDGIEVVIDIEPGLTAAAKPIAVQHILLNLVLNARTAMLPGGGVLTIRGRGVERASGESGRWLVIEVGDTGRGMDDAQLARLFEPFYTMPSGAWETNDVPRGTLGTDNQALFRGERRTGTGLGMTICSRLIADCGGALKVQSKVGEGTVVSVGLGREG